MENLNDGKINQTPSMPTPQKQDSRQTLYAVAFAFMIVTMVGTGIAAILSIVHALTISSVITNLPDDDLDFDVEKFARVLFWIVAIFCLINYAWNIPFTLKIKKSMKTLDNPGIAIGVLVLIFSNPISGILVLIASSMQPRTNYY